MTLREIFMFNVKYYRKKAKLTQEKLAELADLSPNYVGNIERENRKVTLDTIEKIAKALEVKPGDLLSEEKILQNN